MIQCIWLYFTLDLCDGLDSVQCQLTTEMNFNTIKYFIIDKVNYQHCGGSATHYSLDDKLLVPNNIMRIRQSLNLSEN